MLPRKDGSARGRTGRRRPPNKRAGTSIWRDLNGDGEYQAEDFAPKNDRVRPGLFRVDQKGNIWMAYSFFRYDFQGFDEHGNPIYLADKITVLDPHQGVSRIARVVYLDDSDTLIVAEPQGQEPHLPLAAVTSAPRQLVTLA